MAPGTDFVAIRASVGVSNLKLAAQYGVNDTQISRVRSGKTWAHVEQIFNVELNGPLAEALCQYAEETGAEPSTIIAEAVRSYMGDAA